MGMRHRVAGKTLSRTESHRRAMFRNLAVALFTHGQITTTIPKAKAVKPFVEKLITSAKAGDLAARRRIAANLGYDRILVKSEDDEALIRSKKQANRPGGYQGKLIGGPKIVKYIVEEIAPKYADRNGGYTRIIKLAKHRIGDGTSLCVLQLVGGGAASGEDGPQVGGKYSRRREAANHRMDFAAERRKGADKGKAKSGDKGPQGQNDNASTSDTVEGSRGAEVAKPGDESGGPTPDETK